MPALRGQLGRLAAFKMMLCLGIISMGLYSSVSWLQANTLVFRVLWTPAVGLEARSEALPDLGQCPSVLRGMTVGVWRPGPMTASQHRHLMDSYNRTREDQQIPASLQRPDGRCGNVTFPNRKMRALCQPDGPTPCCLGNACVNRTISQCACTGCWDMRTRVQAEFAEWRPSNPDCRPRDLSVQQTCRLLRNSTLVFVGDSLMRHLYIALLMAVSGDDEAGAFEPNTPQDLRSRCSGLYMFRSTCRMWIDRTRDACDGTARLRFLEWFSLQYSPQITETVLKYANLSRTLIVMGIGFHDDCVAERHIRGLVRPLLQRMATQRLSWPRLLWTELHQLGLLHWIPRQTNPRIVAFNRRMLQFLGPWHVPVFNMFNLTGGVMSSDGTHFGRGVNKVKAHILLNYLLELHHQGQW